MSNYSRYIECVILNKPPIVIKNKIFFKINSKNIARTIVLQIKQDNYFYLHGKLRIEDYSMHSIYTKTMMKNNNST